MRITALMLMGCVGGDAAEDPEDWFDAGVAYEVAEPVAFTDQPYGLPAAGPGLADVLDPFFTFDRGFGTRIAASDQPVGTTCSSWIYDEGLPVEITGIATLMPRYYYKADGCTSDDEKFYGSYFLADDSGGVFVLGDTKVAHFDMGDRVTIRVRGARRSFDQNMIYGHDIVAIERVALPISYEVKQAPFGADDISQVRRVTGEVLTDPDTFGEFYLQPDDWAGTCNPGTPSTCVVISLDTELNRRGISFAPGDRATFTGPILYSFSAYKLIVLRLGQIERL